MSLEKILLIGEASFVHTTLKKGLTELGYSVTLASGGNNWHNAPRDIDLRRDMRWGFVGGLKVLWTLLRNAKKLCGNDVVQIHNYQIVPLRMYWNKKLLDFIKRHNRCVVKCCLGDDPQILSMQEKGVPQYSDTFWNGMPQNTGLNRKRIEEHQLPECVECWEKASETADVLVACLYEYYLCYDTKEFRKKLRYIPLPIVIPPSKPKKRDGKIRILVGVQTDRDYMKGARKIAGWIETLRKQETSEIDIKYVENVPYDKYCLMLEEADVLVDQLYSYTPSMNSLAAMARGTVVVGGGEEAFYRFIGEEELRPIINVSPEYSDERNIEILRNALFTKGNIERLSQQSVAFVKKYHDYMSVTKKYESLYRTILLTR